MISTYNDYLDDCVVMLTAMGVVPTENDTFLILCINRSIDRILNMTNIINGVVPKRLYHVLVTMACGYYVKQKYQSGQLKEVFSFESKSIKSWTMGDTSYTYNDAVSPEENFLTMMDAMIDGKKGEIIKYRKLRW